MATSYNSSTRTYENYSSFNVKASVNNYYFTFNPSSDRNKLDTESDYVAWMRNNTYSGGTNSSIKLARGGVSYLGNLIPTSVYVDNNNNIIISNGNQLICHYEGGGNNTINLIHKEYATLINLQSILIDNISVNANNLIYDSNNDCYKYAFNDTNIHEIIYTTNNNITSIGASAFRYCSNLTSITIPDSVTSIGNYAFQNCSRLGSATIPKLVTSIGYCAFDGCANFNRVKIGNSVTSIGNNAFRNCSKLTFVRIPDSVTIIGGAAFYGCSSLTSVIIGVSVTSIGSSAFSGCKKLNSITCYPMTAPTCEKYNNNYAVFCLFGTNTPTQDDYSGYQPGTLYVPIGSTGYDLWMSKGDNGRTYISAPDNTTWNHWLGYYRWTSSNFSSYDQSDNEINSFIASYMMWPNYTVNYDSSNNQYIYTPSNRTKLIPLKDLKRIIHIHVYNYGSTIDDKGLMIEGIKVKLYKDNSTNANIYESNAGIPPNQTLYDDSSNTITQTSINTDIYQNSNLLSSVYNSNTTTFEISPSDILGDKADPIGYRWFPYYDKNYNSKLPEIPQGYNYNDYPDGLTYMYDRYYDWVYCRTDVKCDISIYGNFDTALCYNNGSTTGITPCVRLICEIEVDLFNCRTGINAPFADSWWDDGGIYKTTYYIEAKCRSKASTTDMNNSRYIDPYASNYETGTTNMNNYYISDDAYDVPESKITRVYSNGETHDYPVGYITVRGTTDDRRRKKYIRFYIPWYWVETDIDISVRYYG